MKLVNLYSGPGSGKSTMAAHLFSHLKKNNYKTELVGEFAKELIYLGNETQLVNQVYIMGCQYRKLKDLQRHNIDIAISDSPLLLQLVYCRHMPYYEEMKSLVYKLNDEFDNIDVFVKRATPYQTYGRVNSEKEAKELDTLIWNSMNGNFDYVVTGDHIGLDTMSEEVIKIADKQLLARF